MTTSAEETAPSPQYQPVWSADPVIAWLLAEGRLIGEKNTFLVALFERVHASGFPIDRSASYLFMLHPLYYGEAIVWAPEFEALQTYQAQHEDREAHASFMGPITDITARNHDRVRRRLDRDLHLLDSEMYTDRANDGYTDYYAMVLLTTGRIRNVMSICTRRAGGFTDQELTEFERLRDLIALVLERLMNQMIARTVLDTYMGSTTGGRVLDGQIRRGDGDPLHAVIWFCDLRGSVGLSEQLSHAAFLDLLNDYFEATAAPLIEAGGEVLRFIGDASLGVVPISDEAGRTDACARAVAAAREARQRALRISAEREAAGKPGFSCGIGLHLGDVMFGNIGVPMRLEFTVIGAAANHAARIEGLCRPLGQSVLASGAIAAHDPSAWRTLGRHTLRGASEPVEVFALERDEDHGS